jgi:hypothetical protein
MWGFSLLLFGVVSLVGSSVIMCRKLWFRIPFVLVLLLFPTLQSCRQEKTPRIYDFKRTEYFKHTEYI